ncbi:super-infection exclusion protein B [Gilliamella apicola]|uniref:super-infection exclusion protein B n=1 Tax=Gilliamella apicola TaxID=1196095 RepID=UPI000A343C01|nr:super-infection exclusion protein B [Gilliamella apicola]OTP93788.1 hypothetical protein B6D13_09285 [Gilliamella apicola]OTQ00755.1 hypothetical protein B6D07_09985 [Gilliamella apicola]OTQ30402.1 hypothetical protein B6D02_05295 [Gilliamella apicola]
MPDWLITLVSNFKKEIFTVKSMLIMLTFFSSFFVVPAEVRIKFEEVIKIPFSYEIALFAVSFILCSFIYYVIVKFYNKKKLNKKRNELLSLIDSLDKKEKGIISYLLYSGYPYISFEAKKIPESVNKLINKGIIIQSSYPMMFDTECRFMLNSSFETFIRNELKQININNN